MEDPTGNIISILGFYLTLISLLGSFFYLHLGQWVKQIQFTCQKWNQYKFLNNEPDERTKKLECLFEAIDERNLQPAIGFALLTTFMLIVGKSALELRVLIPAESSFTKFLYSPGYLFFFIYLFASSIYLFWGYLTADKLLKEIRANLKIKSDIILVADEAGAYYDYRK